MVENNHKVTKKDKATAEAKRNIRRMRWSQVYSSEKGRAQKAGAACVVQYVQFCMAPHVPDASHARRAKLLAKWPPKPVPSKFTEINENNLRLHKLK